MTPDVEQGEHLSLPRDQKVARVDNEGDFKDQPRSGSRAAQVFDRVEKLLRLGRVEAKGIEPVPIEERKSTRYWNIFTIWCSMNTNILG